MVNDVLVPPETQSTPEYDDFDPQKDFLRVLFRPGRAVQARELTQLQTILQKQVQRLGWNLYEINGIPVLGGHITYQGVNEGILSLNLSSNFANTTINASAFLLSTINCGSSLAKATVLVTDEANASGEPPTLVIRPLNGTSFQANSNISVIIDSLQNTGYQGTIQASSNASVVSISEGVAFYNGFLIPIYPQTIFLDKYDNTPTFRVGLQFNEIFVDESIDSSLLDPALEASNFQGPGARRYQVFLQLSKRPLTSIDDSEFIELFRVTNGVAVQESKYPIFQNMADLLAKRTMDQSGNYVINPFLLSLNNHFPQNLSGTISANASSNTIIGYNNANFSDEVANGSILFCNNEVVQVTSISNNTLTISPALINGVANITGMVSSPSKFSVKLSPGRAYLKGADIEYPHPHILGVKRSQVYANNFQFQQVSPLGSFVYITNLQGIPNINNMELFDIHLVPASQVNLTSNATYNTTLIGNCSVRALEFFSGGANTSNSQLHTYSTYLFNIQMANNSVAGMNIAKGLVSHLSVTTGGYNRLMDVSISSTANGALNGNTVVFDVAYAPLIYPLPQTTIVPGTMGNISYIYRKLFTGISFVNGLATITVSSPDTFWSNGTNQLSEADALAHYTITVTSSPTLANGLIIPLTSALNRTVTVSPSTQATINVNLVTSTFTGDISASLVSNPTSSRVKTYTYSGVSQNVQPFGGGSSPQAGISIYSANNQVQVQVNTSAIVVSSTVPQSLWFADIAALSGVLDFNGNNITQANLSGASNISSNFILDNGQRDTFYGYGSIKLKQNAPAPTGPLLIYLDYYSHSGISGYLTVDSYSVPYSQIPTYTSPTTGKVYSLRDCIDWRPTVQNGVVGPYQFLNSRILEPYPQNTGFTSNFSFYLGRVDKLVLTDNRTFKIIEGVPNLYPEPPTENPNDLLLYTLRIPPYTFHATDVDVRAANVNRYSMSELGRIRERLENAEYYASYNFLQGSNETSLIIDSTGTIRNKVSTITDLFTGHKLGDVSSYDYLCSMDYEKAELHATFKSVNSIFLVNSLSNAVNLGGQITLDYSLVDYIIQNNATSVESVNPFAYSTWIQPLKLLQDNDTWYDQTTRPQVLVNTEGESDSWETIGSASWDNRNLGFGTRYNDWNAIWNGLPETRVQTSSIQYAQDQVQYLDSITRGVLSSSQLENRQITGKLFYPHAIKKIVGDFTIDTSTVPFMRPVDITVYADGLKPSTVYYPFFDGVSMLPYWIQPTFLVVNANTLQGTLNWQANEIVTSNTGGRGTLMSAPHALSVFANLANPVVIVTGSNGNFAANNLLSGASGNVVVTQVINLSGNVIPGSASTINIGNFGPSNAIFQNFLVGNASIMISKGTGAGLIRLITSYDAQNTLVGIDHSYGTPVTPSTQLDSSSVWSIGFPMTDALGTLVGTLHIPNGVNSYNYGLAGFSSTRFLTGEKKLRLSTSIVNDPLNQASYAEGTFYATGVLNTRNEVLVSPRNPQVLTSSASQETVVNLPLSEDTTTQVIKRNLFPTQPENPIVGLYSNDSVENPIIGISGAGAATGALLTQTSVYGYLTFSQVISLGWNVPTLAPWVSNISNPPIAFTNLGGIWNTTIPLDYILIYSPPEG